jgi:hypothetical protein
MTSCSFSQVIASLPKAGVAISPLLLTNDLMIYLPRIWQFPAKSQNHFFLAIFL